MVVVVAAVAVVVVTAAVIVIIIADLGLHNRASSTNQNVVYNISPETPEEWPPRLAPELKRTERQTGGPQSSGAV